MQAAQLLSLLTGTPGDGATPFGSQAGAPGADLLAAGGSGIEGFGSVLAAAMSKGASIGEAAAPSLHPQEASDKPGKDGGGDGGGPALAAFGWQIPPRNETLAKILAAVSADGGVDAPAAVVVKNGDATGGATTSNTTQPGTANAAQQAQGQPATGDAAGKVTAGMAPMAEMTPVADEQATPDMLAMLKGRAEAATNSEAAPQTSGGQGAPRTASSTATPPQPTAATAARSPANSGETATLQTVGAAEPMDGEDTVVGNRTGIDHARDIATKGGATDLTGRGEVVRRAPVAADAMQAAGAIRADAQSPNAADGEAVAEASKQIVADGAATTGGDGEDGENGGLLARRTGADVAAADAKGKGEADKAKAAHAGAQQGAHGDKAHLGGDAAAGKIDADRSAEERGRSAAARAMADAAGPASKNSAAAPTAYAAAGDGAVARESDRRIGAARFDDLDPLTGQSRSTGDIGDRVSPDRAERTQPRMPTPPTEQVAVKLRAAAMNGDSRFSIRLMPEELGRVDIDLEIDGDGKLRASIRAERPEALDLLSRDARQLERALQDAGFKADRGGLEFSLAGGDADGDGRGQAGSTFADMLGDRSGRGGNDGRNASGETTDIAAEPVFGAGADSPMHAADGRVDIQI